MNRRAIVAAINFIRPANVNAYTAGQLLSPNASGAQTAVPAFAGIGTNITGARGYITGVTLLGSGTISSDFKLWLFNSSVGAVTDASALTLSAAQGLALIGVVSFLGSAALAASNAGTFYQANPNLAFAVGSGATIYPLLQTVGGFTPLSGQTFNLGLFLDLF